MFRNCQWARIVITIFIRTVSVYKSVLCRFPGYSVFVIVCTIITGVIPIVMLWLTKVLMDAAVAYLSSPSEMRLFKSVIYVVGLYLLVDIVSSIILRCNSYVLGNLSQMYSLKIQEEVYTECGSMDYCFYETPELRNILYRAQTESPAAANAMLVSVFSLSRSGITVVGSAVALYLFSPGLFVVAVFLIAPSFILSARLGRQQYEIVKNQTERVRKANYVEDVLIQKHYARDNILFGTWRHFLNLWKTLQEKTLAEDIKMRLRRAGLGGFTEALGRFAHCGTYLYVIWATGAQLGTIGAVVMNVGLFDRVQNELRRISDIFVGLHRNSIFLDDYYNLQKMDSKIERQKEGLDEPEEIRSIEFQNVAFKYPNSERYALSDVSFDIKAGECVCFVGCNGAGKSTIVKLMLRLFDPLSGRALINERNLQDYTTEGIRRAFGVLMQDFSAYLLSFKENVLVGDLKKADQKESFWRAVDRAGLRETVESLPKREETILGKIFGDGEDLSIGEWQKLGLARIFFRDAGVFVLDEPTSALDAKTEEVILEQFRERTRGKISIIVSHRFSSARIADKIIVVDSGRVVEIGTHAELMERNGVYANLFRIQRKRYVGDETDRVEADLNASLYEAWEAEK